MLFHKDKICSVRSDVTLRRPRATIVDVEKQ